MHDTEECVEDDESNIFTPVALEELEVNVEVDYVEDVIAHLDCDPHLEGRHLALRS